MHISLAAEPLFYLYGFPVTNSLLVAVIVSFLLIIFSFLLSSSIKKSPKRLQVIVELIFGTILDLAESIAGQKGRLFAPLVITFFVFILLCNWIGLLPGFGSLGFFRLEGEHKVFIPLFRGATADLNMTFALAIISVGAMQYFGLSALKLAYLKRFFNFKSPIAFFVGILELVSDLAKIISFAFRLFGNIFAGEVLLVVISTLIPIIAPLPFFGLEIFVGLIQALVFAMLSLVFFKLAVSAHGEEEVIPAGH